MSLQIVEPLPELPLAERPWVTRLALGLLSACGLAVAAGVVAGAFDDPPEPRVVQVATAPGENPFIARAPTQEVLARPEVESTWWQIGGRFVSAPPRRYSGY